MRNYLYVLSVLCRSFVDYTHPDVFSGLRYHSLASELWSLGIVAHFALFGTNPYYKYCQTENKFLYKKNICMEKEKYNKLGPKLRRRVAVVCTLSDGVGFFRSSLAINNDISISELLSLYDKLNEPEFHSQPSSTTVTSKLHLKVLLSSMKLY